MTDSRLADVPLDDTGAPIPGVTPAGWYPDPTSKTGERVWTGKKWNPYTRRPRNTPLGPFESMAEIGDRMTTAREAKAAAKFAHDYPELAAQQEAERQAAATAPEPVPVVVTGAPIADASPALNAEVAKYARQGYTVTDRTPTQVILQRKQKIGAWRILIFVLLAITIIGLFLIPLVARALSRKVESVIITADADGKVRVRKS